jgi:DNA-binding transcriptional LysR family regulator
MQTILSLVEAEEGVAIVPASSSSLRSNGVQFIRLVPGNLYLDLIVAWPLGEASAVLRTFLDFLSANEGAIRAKAELTLSSIARNRS